ncbi:unannotated protein [freshwater metagenome]|uniref:Unannotated protein n=1 Tax=freshwater metagenome TaxID=449393 RepID=A0A6J6BHA5_9ZZZZ
MLQLLQVAALTLAALELPIGVRHARASWSGSRS